MGKRIVIALGGNALGSNLPEQMIAVKQTAKAIVDLIEEGHEVIIAHGSGGPRQRPPGGHDPEGHGRVDPLRAGEVHSLSSVRMRGHEPGLHWL